MNARARGATGVAPTLDGLRAVCGFNAHLDLVHRLSEERLGALRRALPPGQWRAFRDSTLRGEPREVGAPRAVHEALEAALSPWEQEAGGQAGIAGSALASLGARVTIATPWRNPSLRRVLHPRASLAGAVRGRVKANRVLEYRSGMLLPGGRAPAPGRFILSDDAKGYRAQLPASMPTRGIDLLFLGGFHNEPPLALRASLPILVRQLDKVRRASPRAVVHVELQNARWRGVHVAVLRALAGRIDSLGLDAVELRQAMASLGNPHPKSLAAQLGAMRLMRRAFALERVHLHTPRWLACVTTRVRDAQEIREAHLAASAACDSTATSGTWPRAGQRGADALARAWPGALARARGQRTAGGIRLASGEATVVVPKTLVARPRRTVGLGDVVSAVSLAAEIRARR